MRKSFSILLLLTILLVKTFTEGNCEHAAEGKYSKLSMKVVELSNRFDTKKPAAFLKILFKNNNKTNVDFRFSGTLSFGGVSVLERRGLAAVPSYFWALPDGYKSVGGAFSLVEYEWRHENGAMSCSGTYDVSQPGCILEPGKSITIYVPIVLPSQPGNYVLYTRFDNRCVEALALSCSNIPNINQLAIFETCDHTKIRIPESIQKL